MYYADTRRPVRDLHGSLPGIVGVINRPQRDELLIKEAAIPLDRALFPLLLVIDKFGPIGVVDLADRVGGIRVRSPP